MMFLTLQISYADAQIFKAWHSIHIITETGYLPMSKYFGTYIKEYAFLPVIIYLNT
jgi:hypothetical protein